MTGRSEQGYPGSDRWGRQVVDRQCRQEGKPGCQQDHLALKCPPEGEAAEAVLGIPEENQTRDDAQGCDGSVPRLSGKVGGEEEQGQGDAESNHCRRNNMVDGKVLEAEELSSHSSHILERLGYAPEDGAERVSPAVQIVHFEPHWILGMVEVVDSVRDIAEVVLVRQAVDRGQGCADKP